MLFYDFSLLAPTLLLLVACMFDIKTGRFPNWLFLTSTGVSLAFLLASKSAFIPVVTQLVGSFVFFMALTPLFFFGVVGAGDLKLMGVFCLLTSPLTSFTVIIYSLFWGLTIGLLKLTVSGELLTFTQSLILRNPQPLQQKIPYTVAILLGWLSFLSTGGVT